MKLELDKNSQEEVKNEAVAIYHGENLQTEYNTQITKIITNNDLGIKITEGQVNLILHDLNVDVNNVYEIGLSINESDPNISKENLVIMLLTWIANNKTNKKLSKIASEMLSERWWEK